jgi:8-oxo-dGTP pyrophosphatase MutT (NUDIX family)
VARSLRAGEEPPLPPAVDAMTLLVGAVILHDQKTEQVVLLQRGPNAKFARGQWDLPVGKSHPGEPITQTAVRELHEETGLVVEPGDLELAHVIHSSYGVESPNGFLTIVFTAHTWTGTLSNVEAHKHAQVAWVNTSAIPENFVPTTHRALTNYLGNGPRVSLNGWDKIQAAII